MKDLLLITPPFTQLSSPYASNPFLKGYLTKVGISTNQTDLGLDIFLDIFSKNGLELIFKEAEKKLEKIIKDEKILNIYENKNIYINNIDEIIKFLQNKNNQFAYYIINNLNISDRKKHFDEFGLLKSYKKTIYDYALLISTFIIDDLSDFINFICDGFRLSSYKDYIISSGLDFSSVQKELVKEDLISNLLYERLKSIDFKSYKAVSITFPFPGTLILGLKIAKYIKEKFPYVKIIIGGGYINTDLRNIKTKEIFKYVDYICLDYGEKVIERLLKSNFTDIPNCFYLKDEKINFRKESIDIEPNCYPNYSDLELSNYITLKETTNKMHNLWSERLFLKHRMALGCYHHNCNFCDTELDYIKIYRQSNAEKLVESIKEIISKTGISSFHFVDEAMPPSLVKEFCLLIIKEKLVISWWGNIRFDKAFTFELARLMSKAGCIAVTGGLEACCEKTLKLINKKVFLDDLIITLYNFSKNNILVHSYLIYGLPNETFEDIIYSLEIVRQLFKENILDSAFYHRFALTDKSPFFKDSEKFGIKIIENKDSDFSNCEVKYTTKIPFKLYSDLSSGIEKAIYNFNHGYATENNIITWFSYLEFGNYQIDLKLIKNLNNHVQDVLKKSKSKKIDRYFNKKVYWLGENIEIFNNYVFIRGFKSFTYDFDKDMIDFIRTLIEKIINGPLPFEEFKDIIKPYFTIETFFENDFGKDLMESGLFFL